MFNGVEHAYDTIISNKGMHDDYVMHIFKSLMSTKNSIFRDYIQDFKNRWEDDDEIITSNYLISKAKAKFANMVKSKDLYKSGSTNAEMMALLTAQKDTSSSYGRKGGGSKRQSTQIFRLQAWIFAFKR